jgi:hypothetical protein
MRKGLAGLAVVLCTVAAPGCGSGKSAAQSWNPPVLPPIETHRVVIGRSWTPSVLPEITHRVDPDPRVSARLVYRSHVPNGNPKGWWFVLTDPRLTPNSAVELRDLWTAELVGRMYLDRRESSAAKLSGVAVAARPSEFENGENSLFWGSASAYSQARPAVLRAHIEQRAATLGLRLRSFRVPALGGILAPLVVLQVSDLATFRRWYDPGCAEAWLFGPRAANGSPYFGFYLSVIDASGDWIYSMAATPNSGATAGSTLEAKLFPPPPNTPGQIGGMRACPSRFA